MDIMLLDSAKLQEEEADYAKKKGYSKHEDPKPLYTEEDAKAAMKLFKPVEYGEEVTIHDRVKIRFSDAGHLLGSAITEIFIQGDSQRKKIVFSGDIGRYQQAMLRQPTAIAETDILFIESTYGNTDNKAIDPEPDLIRIANETFSRGGVLVIPAFAVGRTQGLLYYFRKLMKEDKIPDVPVYVDSPMAISATYLFYKHPSYHKVSVDSKELAEEIETNMLVFVKSRDHSRELNDLKGNARIIAASGMMTGGRILHHLFHRLKNPKDTLLIAGYQAEGTRGRLLLEGRDTLKVFGEQVPVKAKIEYMSAMSGHADREELFRWMGSFTAKPKITFCVHGEGEKLQAYAQEIRDRLKWNVIVPEYLETVELFSGI
jgi:metallo-beta-lactamase family protein